MFNECRHILSGGDRCHAAALRNKPYCYFHEKLHRVSKASGSPNVFPLPPIEDDGSIKLALNQILNALSSPDMDLRRAGLMLYALQIAAQISARTSSQTPPKTVRSVSTQRDGSELAPAQVSCDPIEDCNDCPAKDRCQNLTRISYRTIAPLLDTLRKRQDMLEQKDREQTAALSLRNRPELLPPE